MCSVSAGFDSTRLSASSPQFWRKSVRRNLLRWYRRHRRNLPWRGSADPYQVWVSEIMLQQTTTTAVVPYFERFLGQFPTVADLAAADVSQVLREWEGLGYYSRACNLHRAAQRIMEEFNGKIPETADALRRLPGIGPYTARAIACLAFGWPLGVLEANTQRLYSRLIECDAVPRSASGRQLLWTFADWIVSPRKAEDFNQAAMDLGATVCTSGTPACVRCPLRKQCGAFRSGRQLELPVSRRKIPPTQVTEVSIVICRRGRVLMRQYMDGERWAGLWDFVRFPVSTADRDVLARCPMSGRHQQACLFESGVAQAISGEIRRRTALEVDGLILLRQIRHSVTRYRIQLFCLEATRVTGRADRSAGWVWTPIDGIGDLPLSTTARETANLVTSGRS